jgi:hypothetical protein
MAADKSSLSDYLAELGVDINNLQEFLLKLSLILSTKSDSVTINQTLQDGTTAKYLVPSFGYLSGRVNSIEQKFNDLLTGNANQFGVKDAEGNLKTFELKDISAVISDLENVSNSGVTLPANFNYKTNWFFESFLNPLLYINVDTSTITADSDINKFEVKRLIITSKTQANLDYFDATYKGKNDLVYADVIKDLGTRIIDYFEDESEVELPPSKNTVRGTFDILQVLEDSSTELIGGQTLSNAIRRYKLNTLRYSTISGSTTVDKLLAEGDILLASDNSEFKVKTIDANSKTVILSLIFGTAGLKKGAAELRIKPQLTKESIIQVNLGYNERNLIFLRPISNRLSITTDQYSKGFGIFTNELNITMNNGNQLSLTDFYTTYVSDFGMLFLSYAKEKKLPSSLGQIPNRVAISADNFKVIQTDQHIQDADNTLAIKQKISAKEQAVAQIREIDTQISAARANLNTNASLNESQRLKLQKDLSTFSDTRATLTNTQQSLISDITTSIKSTPSFITNPSYRVRGFWAIPEPLSSAYGVQQVAQFKIAYRTLSKTGNSKTADQLEFVDAAGNRVTGAFSPWTEYLSKARTKTLNPLTGFYEWADENISDPNQVNANQLDIPIKKGEVIEIRIKSLSEAGWPDSPVESDWSDTILIEFPAGIETAEDATIVSQQAFADETRINFQSELNAKGLDIHLSSAFTTRDKYFAHKSEDIASGFFASDGSVVDLYTKVKSISDSISAVQTSLSTGAGALSVSIVDQSGNQQTITNGQSLELFAGYYKDLIKDTSVVPVVYNHGRVLATQYLIQLQNTSQTPLQLISTLNGGLAEIAPSTNAYTNPAVNYHANLRYDRAPLVINNSVSSSIGGFVQKDGYQSSQVRSQYIYARYKSVTLANFLYSGDKQGGSAGTPSTYGDGDFAGVVYSASTSNYTYAGITIGSTKVPYSSGHYLPFNPTTATPLYTGAAVTNTNIWNGVVTSNVPEGGGQVSEFCIHKSHPSIIAGGSANITWNNSTYNVSRPTYSVAETIQKYLPFSHAIHFETTEAESQNVFGANYYEQAVYVKPASVILGTTAVNMRENQYPIKMGFVNSDEWLVGKYTCGAYLYIAPQSHTTISVDGLSPAGSQKMLDFGAESAIKIPLIFQFRASDKLGYVGGWRSAVPAGLKNVRYAKKLGIDIYSLNSVFSFDVLVRTQYEKETAVVTPVSALAVSSTGIGASA